MAAHLHRYGTELSRFEDITMELESLYDKLKPAVGGKTEPSEDKYRIDTLNEISQLLSQTRAIKYFRNELEKKIQNILALVWEYLCMPSGNWC
jgi:nitrate/nitrite-specific signal transduction histidine kinase